MPKFKVEVWLDDNLFATPLAQQPDWRLALECELEERDHGAAAEFAYAICNSHPTEMHVDDKYLPLVSEYRKARNRSLSVGDKVVVNGKEFYCDNVGFTETPVGLLGSRFSDADEDGPSIISLR